MIELPDLNIQFEEENHVYTLPDGTTPPSVTHIMRFMSRELYDGIPYDTLQKAAERGTRVHKQTEYLDIYGYTEPDEDTEFYIEGYKTFKQHYNPVWIAREWMGYHKLLRYCGMIDNIGYVTPDDGTGVDIVDLKATRVFHTIMLATQVSGGYKAMLESHGVKVRNCYGLQLLADGTYRFERLGDGFKTFIHCLALHNEMSKEIKP